MADAEEPDVLVLSDAELSSAPALAALAGMQGVGLRHVRSVEAAEAALEAAPLATPLIVIGPGENQPILAARRLLRASPSSRTVLLAARDDVERLSELLAFVPDLSHARAVDAQTALGTVQAMVSTEVGEARKEHQAAALPDRLNRMLARADAEQEPRRPYRTLWQGFFSAVLSQAPDPIFATDLEGGLLTCNAAALDMFGEEQDEHEQSSLQPLQLPAPWLERLSGLLNRAASGEAVRHHEINLPSAKRGEIVLSVSAAPVSVDKDEITCISFVARNITEQKTLEHQQMVLVRELNHRLKNALGLVHSLARRTAQQSQDLEAFLPAFSGRLQAMSAAHGLLSESWWRGARLSDVARGVLEPYSREQQIRMDLPGTELSPELSSSLALVFNELATNAIKYGSLSTTSGEVVVTGREVFDASASVRRLELRWEEKGGPLVSAPTGQGFGTRLISQLITYQHQGEAAVEWPETGLICSLRIPLEGL